MSQFDPNSPNNYPPQGNPNSWPPPSNQPPSGDQSWSQGQSSGWSQDQAYGQGSQSAWPHEQPYGQESTPPPPPPPDQGYGNYAAPQGQPYGYGGYPPPPQGQPYASGGYGQQQQYYMPLPQMYPGVVPMQCPYCHAYAPPRIVQKVSSAGWVVFVILLFFCFPLCWIGLLIKEDQRSCTNCGGMLG